MESSELIKSHFNESIQTMMQSTESVAENVSYAGAHIVQCLLNNNKILACGNGGSAGDAMHFTSEMINRFESERPSLPAIALGTDVNTLTAIANDYCYDDIYAKQIRALGHAGDILMAFSTSGNSTNVIRAIEIAQQRDMRIIALTGKDGGEIGKILTHSDIEIRVPAERTARIQETHLVIIHALCDMIDKELFITEE